MGRPTVDTYVPLADDLNVVYSLWPDGTIFRRTKPLSELLCLHPYVMPARNSTVATLWYKGVDWVLAEHVSITVQGQARYEYDTPSGRVEDIGLPGCHNVENGGGYLPVLPFTRWLSGNHISCCVMRTPGPDMLPKYLFKIASAPDGKALFSHRVEGLIDTFIIVRLLGGP